MPAPDLATLFAVESAIEEAWKSIVTAQGINAYTAFSSQTLNLPCATIELRLSSPTGHRGQYAPGKFVFDAWTGLLVSTIRTVRGDKDINNAMLGKMRLAAQYFENPFTSDILPWHGVAEIKEAGMSRSIDHEFDLDVTEFSLSLTFFIRPDAWPIPTP
jgi:hypothetical protein